jgi:hypothetical protein
VVLVATHSAPWTEYKPAAQAGRKLWISTSVVSPAFSENIVASPLIDIQRDLTRWPRNKQNTTKIATTIKAEGWHRISQ